MAVINTNYKALYSQAALKGTERSLQTAMQQLSTGKRINSAKDDAAGMAIATRMTQQIRALDQSVRNANDAISLIQTVEGATESITDMMQRMRELAVQAVNDTNANEQRSYLDLEFQQLKQEIQRVADTTEWNGFQVLNGSAGDRVGARPVYKATADAKYDTVFVDPTTVRTVGGADAGEVHSLTFDVAAADGPITVGGIQVPVKTGDTAAQIASNVVRQLNLSTAYGPGSGRSVKLDPSDATNATVLISASPTEAAFTVNVVDTNSVFGAPITETISAGIAKADENFYVDGKFLVSGALQMSIDTSKASPLSATFLLNDGSSVDMTGTLDAVNGKVTFTSTDNPKILSNDLSYDLLDASDAAVDLSTTPYRKFSVDVDVSGSLPALRSGDMVINGVNIGASYPTDDTVSPPNNKAGSSIAIAAAINRQSDLSGVRAVVNPNTMRGTAMSGTAVVSGYVTINGFKTPEITTVLNNTIESRAAVVQAINFISDKTGIVAVDSQKDGEGVRLFAQDGRNIEVSFDDLTSTAAEFQQRTGLRSGVQGGTYSLESKAEQTVTVTTSPAGDISRARLSTAAYVENVSNLVSDAREPVSAADIVADPNAVKYLKEGDLVINGFAVPGSLTRDDDKSYVFEPVSTSPSSRAGSAIAIAAAINKVAGDTGVSATAYGASTTADTTDIANGPTSGLQSLYINGVEVQVDFGVGTTKGERVDEVVKQVNLLKGAHGVIAEKTDTGGLRLTTVDGRNLSVWFDSASLTAANFGLGLGSGNAPGVAGVGDLTNPGAEAETVYGRVTLTSDKAFKLSPGVNGYKDESNFNSLGFFEGKYGGVVRDADGKMTPPRTGRLAFQVGATAGQLITIDLADFGKRGPITNEITGDLDKPLTVTTAGKLTTTEVTSGLQSLFVNGVEIKVMFGNDTKDERLAKMVTALNAAMTQTGVKASSGLDGLKLETLTGGNLSVWFDTLKVSDATEFGLGGADGVTGEPGATVTFGNAKVLYPANVNIRSRDSASAVLSMLDRSMDKVNANRANMGAVMNRLQYAVDNLQTTSTNMSASRSQIQDADYAKASTELAKSQIMQQAATAVLAQANQSQQTVLKLLGG